MAGIDRVNCHALSRRINLSAPRRSARGGPLHGGRTPVAGDVFGEALRSRRPSDTLARGSGEDVGEAVFCRCMRSIDGVVLRTLSAQRNARLGMPQPASWWAGFTSSLQGLRRPASPICRSPRERSSRSQGRRAAPGRVAAKYAERSKDREVYHTAPRQLRPTDSPDNALELHLPLHLLRCLSGRAWRLASG